MSGTIGSMRRGQKQVCLHCFEIDEDEFGFCEVAKNLKSAEFLKTQREKFEADRMRAITNAKGAKGYSTRQLMRTMIP